MAENVLKSRQYLESSEKYFESTSSLTKKVLNGSVQ